MFPMILHILGTHSYKNPWLWRSFKSDFQISWWSIFGTLSSLEPLTCFQWLMYSEFSRFGWSLLKVSNWDVEHGVWSMEPKWTSVAWWMKFLDFSWVHMFPIWSQRDPKETHLYVPNTIPKLTPLDAQLPWCGGHSLDQVQN